MWVEPEATGLFSPEKRSQPSGTYRGYGKYGARLLRSGRTTDKGQIERRGSNLT